MLDSGRKLPSELEHMIFLLVPRRYMHPCLRVAKRVKVWLEKTHYRVVCLSNERKARIFLMSIQDRPDFALCAVETLYIGVAVHLNTATRILTLCSGVKHLTMRFLCHLFGENPILVPLNRLPHLIGLYVDLSSIFNNLEINLPSIAVFRNITHLHLTNAWATWSPAASSIGLEGLQQITHLSTYLSIIRTQPSVLRRVLNRENLQVMVLWRRMVTPRCDVVRFLEDGNLVDQRVVVLSEKLFTHYYLNGSFWARAEKVIEWRKSTGAGPFDSEDNLTSSPVHMTDYTSDKGVKTEGDSESDSDESDEESVELDQTKMSASGAEGIDE